MDAIINLLSQLWDLIVFAVEWLYSGIYDFFVELVKYASGKLLIWWLEMKIFAVKFAWEIAQEILTAFNISQYIQSAWGFLSPDVYSGLCFFRVPEAVNLIVSALATRFVLQFIPFA